nr:ParB/RepB/Spo0J family partition protein [Deinobacterium chartae]
MSDIHVREHFNPRQDFSAQALQSLADSIREHGVLQPLLVRPVQGRLELVAGERRLRAARLAGLSRVPVIVRDLDDRAALIAAFRENLDRADLNPLEEVRAVCLALGSWLGVPQENVPALIGEVRNQGAHPRGAEVREAFEQLGLGSVESWWANKRPLLTLPDDLAQLVRERRLEPSKAVLLARVRDPQVRAQLTRRALEDAVSKAELRALIARQRSEAASPPAVSLEETRRLLSAARLKRLPTERQLRVQELLRELRELLG